jgi:hypothetical protein
MLCTVAPHATNRIEYADTTPAADSAQGARAAVPRYALYIRDQRSL